MLSSCIAAMANMMILFYLFCGGKTEDNLAGIFNLFDVDGNKVGKAASASPHKVSPKSTDPVHFYSRYS